MLVKGKDRAHLVTPKKKKKKKRDKHSAFLFLPSLLNTLLFFFFLKPNFIPHFLKLQHFLINLHDATLHCDNQNAIHLAENHRARIKPTDMDITISKKSFI